MGIMIKRVANVLVVGDIMVDHYINSNHSRISPEAPVPVVQGKETYTLGGAGNVLQNLIALDCNADILAVVGNDEAYYIVKKEWLLLE